MVRIIPYVFGNVYDHGSEKTVMRYTMINDRGISVRVISYGAIITNILTPDKKGSVRDIVLGFDYLEDYVDRNIPRFGAIVGRYANRIRSSKFVLDGKTYNLSKNCGQHHLHGGFKGFHKVLWNSFADEQRVVFTYLSRDGEEGYPGELLCTISYELTDENALKIHMKAVGTKPTPVNLTSHTYFNMAGHLCGSKELYEHYVCINADKITMVDDEMIATGELKDVKRTVYDLQTHRNLGDAIAKLESGFDINYCLKHSENKVHFAARFTHPSSGRFMIVETDQPGLQFYTGNSLNNVPAKDRVTYEKHAGACFETQCYPNGVNIDTFPNSILRPGREYEHTVVYKFGVID